MATQQSTKQLLMPPPNQLSSQGVYEYQNTLLEDPRRITFGQNAADPSQSVRTTYMPAQSSNVTRSVTTAQTTNMVTVQNPQVVTTTSVNRTASPMITTVPSTVQYSTVPPRSTSLSTGTRTGTLVNVQRAPDLSREMDRLRKIEAGWTETYGREMIEENEKLRKKILILEKENSRLKRLGPGAADVSTHTTSVEIQKYETIIRDLHERNTNLTQELTSANDRISVISQQLSNASNQVNQTYIDEKTREFTRMRDELVSENARLKTDLLTVRSEKESLKHQLNSVSNNNSDTQSLITQIEAMQRVNSRPRTPTASKMAMSEIATQELARERQRVTDLEQEIQILRTDIMNHRCDELGREVPCQYHTDLQCQANTNKVIEMYKKKIDENMKTIESMNEKITTLQARNHPFSAEKILHLTPANDAKDMGGKSNAQLLSDLAFMKQRVEQLEAEKTLWNFPSAKKAPPVVIPVDIPNQKRAEHLILKGFLAEFELNRLQQKIRELEAGQARQPATYPTGRVLVARSENVSEVFNNPSVYLSNRKI